MLGGIDGCPAAVATYRTNHPRHQTLVADITDLALVAAAIRR